MNEPKPKPRDIMSDTPRTEHALDVASEISGDDDDEYYRAAAGTLSALARQLERELAQAQARCAEWSAWFKRSGDGSMADLTDVEYREALKQWIRDGNALCSLKEPL